MGEIEMRLQEIRVENALPVRLFAVTDLSDVVVVAGPNGVGKTRLLDRIVAYLRGASPSSDIHGSIVATSPEEVTAWGERSSLDLSSDGDMALFRAMLQANRQRHHWRSSLINFDSDRSIQALQAYQPSFDILDPYEELVPWEATFGRMRDRYQDTLHSMFRLIEAQKQGIASRAIELKRAGETQMNLGFEDPMKPFKDVFAQLLAPKELVDPQPRLQHLEYRQDESTYDFATLSSGEREVVNIAFDFLLRRPEDCVIFFDEPELHLHPELSYRLIQTLQTIGKNNQFVLSTHSPDVITASLDRSVIFLAPAQDLPRGGPMNQAIPVSEADETNQALRMLGQSIGIIALGKRLVLIEGTQSSLDKQTYGSITRGRYPGLVLVPSGGKHAIESFASVYDAILSRSIWGVEFFMLCDKDSAPPSALPEATTAATAGRLRVLSRYHLENYFLDEFVWAEAFKDLEGETSWLRSPEAIREAMRQVAMGLTSYAAALGIASKFRLSVGNVDLMPKECHGKTQAELEALVAAKAEAESIRVSTVLDRSVIQVEVGSYFSALAKSLDEDTEGWKSLIPGKPLLAQFSSRANIGSSRAKTMYINAAASSGRAPFEELFEIFANFERA
jgi:ABC-type cobalamin/Fe3+-siderophores transport system ATPase subunit